MILDVQKRMVTELAAKRDEELCDTLEGLWFAAGAGRSKGIEPNRENPGDQWFEVPLPRVYPAVGCLDCVGL